MHAFCPEYRFDGLGFFCRVLFAILFFVLFGVLRVSRRCQKAAIASSFSISFLFCFLSLSLFLTPLPLTVPLDHSFFFDRCEQGAMTEIWEKRCRESGKEKKAGLRGRWEYGRDRRDFPFLSYNLHPGRRLCPSVPGQSMRRGPLPLGRTATVTVTAT